MRLGLLTLAFGSLIVIGLAGCASEEAPSQTSAPTTEGVQNDAAMDAKTRQGGMGQSIEPPK